MNERISELGDQAWDYALDHETVNGEAAFGSFINKNFSDLLLEKFAELIVRECIKVVDDTMTENQEMNIGLVMASAAIIAHFGVEE